MFDPFLMAALAFLAGMAFLALAQYVIRRLGARRGPTVDSILPTFESVRSTVEPARPAVESIPTAVESIAAAVESGPAAVESIRPVEIVDEELIAVLAAAASETLQASVRVLSYRVEPKR